MYTYTTLENTSSQTLYQAFLAAFADYRVNVGLPFTAFQSLLKRRGYIPEISLGAFAEPDHRLAGFVLNGLRVWDGKLTAYDILTGVTPAHRKQGITSKILPKVIELLRCKNAEQYLAEVLRENTAAFTLYQKQGFEICREFTCFEFVPANDNSPATAYQLAYADKIEPEAWEQLQLFWDYHPSWQNSIDSITAIQEDFSYVLAYSEQQIIGYGIADKKTGDLPQIAVAKAYRRRGVAASIIKALLKSLTDGQLRILNVDDACTEMKVILPKLGFQQTVTQYEILLPLKKA